jgi:hypothetical protein
MGRQSKATLAQLNNLPRPVNPHNPTVEEISDDEDTDFEDEDFLEHGFFFLDEGPGGEEISDDSCGADEEEVDEDKLNGLQNEADIEHFNAILAHAQTMAIKAEREAAGETPKRKRYYMGNSVRTKRYHAQKRRELTATGQKLISSMFVKKKTQDSTLTDGNEALPDVIEIADDFDSSDGEDDEIEASLKQLFPGEPEVNVFCS